MMKGKLQVSVLRAMTICLMVGGLLAARAEEEVLWWQVPDDPDVTTIRLDIKPASEIGVTDARVRIWENDDFGEFLVIPFEDGGSLIDLGSYTVPMEEGAWYAILPSNPEGLSFMVELGNWDESTDTWVGLAHSRAYTYSELSDHIIRNWGGPDAIPASSVWIATDYSVPEPSSGMLLLMGGGLLALRRKRRG